MPRFAEPASHSIMTQPIPELASDTSHGSQRALTVHSFVWLCATLGEWSCAGDQDDAKKVIEPNKTCVASEILPASFMECTCDGVPSDPGPGQLGCSTPKIIYDRVCMIDSSCNAYRHPTADPLAITTLRDDVAFRFEWHEPFPEDADLALNAPAEGDSALLSPFTLFAVKDPTTFNYDFQKMSDAAEAGEVMLSKDRRAATIIPARRCFSGHWFLQAAVNLPLVYGGPVCGESENLQPGYTAYFSVGD
jgi:hypothetical protein